ncbi:hypothetical protein [Methanococcoides sp.]|uniref:hypothetical protein n=1 Tax=Methanococcoides sp. TaxID=1966350 RepID=UPI00272E8399|nr:hypothetical protein [Methanococcoides sp.]
MKLFLKDENAVSVVVGAILLLAIMITFLSVVTSTWVPIYEGDAEAEHSKQMSENFRNLKFQSELTDSLPRSLIIDLGTEDVPLVSNSRSIGYLELNETEGDLIISTHVSNIMEADDPYQFGLLVKDMADTPNPITAFEFEFLQTGIVTSNPGGVDDLFDVQLRTTTHNRWIHFFAEGTSGKDLAINMRYGTPVEVWENNAIMVYSTSDDPKIYVYNDDYVHIDLLTNDTSLTLMSDNPVTINGTTYTNGDSAPLYDLVQHYMSIGETYIFDYVNYNHVIDSSQRFEYVTNDHVTNLTYSNTGDACFFDDSCIGRGTFKIHSDYNFMVDQSYIYENGAVILKQDDGAVFKIEPPISVSGTNGSLELGIWGAVLEGDYQEFGNDLEKMYITADTETIVEGDTGTVSITKNLYPETKDIWISFFEKMKSEIVTLNETGNGTINVTMNVSLNSTPQFVKMNVIDTNSTIHMKVKSHDLKIADRP